MIATKFQGLVLWLVGLIDAKGIGMVWLILMLSDVSSKTGKKCIFCVFRPKKALCKKTEYNRIQIFCFLYFYILTNIDLNHNVAVACVDKIRIAAEFGTHHFWWV